MIEDQEDTDTMGDGSCAPAWLGVAFELLVVALVIGMVWAGAWLDRAYLK